MVEALAKLLRNRNLETEWKLSNAEKYLYLKRDAFDYSINKVHVEYTHIWMRKQFILS